VVHEAAGAHQEAIELVLRIEGLDTVEEAGDDVVAARGLAAGEDDTDVETGIFDSFTLGELHYGHTISVGEEGLDLGLVADGLGRRAFDCLHRALEGNWELGLIGCACDLKIGFDWHNEYYKLLYKFLFEPKDKFIKKI
jgi:hypothetical protein